MSLPTLTIVVASVIGTVIVFLGERNYRSYSRAQKEFFGRSTAYEGPIVCIVVAGMLIAFSAGISLLLWEVRK